MREVIAVADQGMKRIAAYDADRLDLLWSWAPTERDGFARTLRAWGLPTDAKLRACEKMGGLWLVVTDSLGLAAIVPFPRGGPRRWGVVAGGNPHSAELLPNGNVAVASSTGGRVRVYAASQGPEEQTHAEFALPGAHGVEWDRRLRVLWALGDEELVALEIGGTEREPQLTVASRTPLPTRGGHDLQQSLRDPDTLWISTTEAVYAYSKRTGRFAEALAGGEPIRSKHVKSVGETRSGGIVLAAPDGVLRPETGAEDNDWCTSRIVECPGGKPREIAGAAFYKARIWHVPETLLPSRTE